MRIKDDNKKQAINNAVVSLINDVGYANISMSKIAKQAGVSPSTLYTYYENKEEMFKEVYYEEKNAMLQFFNEELSLKNPIKDNVKKLCYNVLKFAENNPQEFFFLSQSVDSPLIDPSQDNEIEELHVKTYQIFKKGIDQGILKQASPYLLIGFCVYPISEFYKEQHHKNSIIENIDFNQIFEMCWDAVST